MFFGVFGVMYKNLTAAKTVKVTPVCLNFKAFSTILYFDNNLIIIK